MSVTFPPRLKKIRKAAEAAGWTADTTAKGHPRLNPPPGLRFVVGPDGSPLKGQVTMEGTGPLVPPVTFSLTPSDHAADRPAKSALRRAGVAV